MTMFTVSFREELKRAFQAGRASTLPRSIGWKVPRTFEEWLAEEAKRPTVVRG